jgi:hypothetical protein
MIVSDSKTAVVRLDVHGEKTLPHLAGPFLDHPFEAETMLIYTCRINIPLRTSVGFRDGGLEFLLKLALQPYPEPTTLMVFV